jgi:hypothetical protein
MQRQPPSMFLVADAYPQELLADAARVRRRAPSDSRRGRSIGLLRLRQLVGTVLIRAGARLQGARPVPAEEPPTTSPHDQPGYATRSKYLGLEIAEWRQDPQLTETRSRLIR